MAKKDIGSYFKYLNTYIEINTLLENSDNLIKVLEKYHIPYKTHHEIMPYETNICVSHGADLKALYIVAYIAEKIFGDKILLYIDYQERGFLDYPECDKRYIYLGTAICQDDNDWYLSKPIYLKKIISLDLLNKEISWDEISSLFPSNNESSDNDNESICLNEKEDNSYGKYSGSYAQDVEGLSDDFIDDALGGDPDAYWNID